MKPSLHLGLVLFACCIPSLISCKARTYDSQISSLGYKPAPEHFFNSIGAFSLEDSGDSRPESIGSGFLIATEGNRAIGLTNDHVWNVCEEGADGCLIYFPSSPDQESWDSYRVKPYPSAANHVKTDSLTEVQDAYGHTLDFAMFQIEGDVSKLKPLKIYAGKFPQRIATRILSVGYPGGLFRKGESQESTMLVSTVGFGSVTGPWSERSSIEVQAEILVHPELITFSSHARSGQSGSPIMVDTKSGPVVVGIIYAGSGALSRGVEVDSFRSAARDLGGYLSYGWPLSMMRERFPNLPIWKLATDVDFRELASKDYSQIITPKYTKGEVVDGESTTAFVFELKRKIDLEKLFVNGALAKYFDGFSQNGDEIKVLIPHTQESNPDLPRISLEYQDNYFVGCYLDKRPQTFNFESSENGEMACFPYVNNEWMIEGLLPR